MLYYQLTEQEARKAKSLWSVPMSFWDRILREFAASTETEARVRLLPTTNYLKARFTLMQANSAVGPQKIVPISYRRDHVTNTFILTKR